MTANGASTAASPKAASKAEQIESRRAEKKEAREKARAEQYALDLEAVDALEIERGYELDISLRVPTFTAGLPSLVGVRPPNATEYKRFFQQVNRAGNADAKMAAHQQLAGVCWVYPEAEDTRAAMLEANPGILAAVGNLAVKLAEVQAADEGKG